MYLGAKELYLKHNTILVIRHIMLLLLLFLLLWGIYGWNCRGRES